MEINKKLLEKMIPLVSTACQNAGLFTEDEKQYKKGVKGKMAGFGPAIRMNKLKAAVLQYSKDKGEAGQEGSRAPIAEAVFNLLKASGVVKITNKPTLFDWVAELNNDALKEAENNIYCAIIACKLFLDTMTEEGKDAEAI